MRSVRRRTLRTGTHHPRVTLAGVRHEPNAIDRRDDRLPGADLRGQRRSGDLFDSDPTAVDICCPARLARAGLFIRYM